MKSKTQMKFKHILLMLLLFACVGIAGAVAANAVSIGPGSNAEAVKEVQTKLKRWGYYSGTVDGQYGNSTIDAVKQFQRKNNLTPDGIVGDATANKIGISAASSKSTYMPSSNSSTSDEVYLIAKCIYGEARGETYTGKVAVGAVILNRVKNAEFPDTIAGVIYQPWAFSVVADGQINLTPDAECIRAARDAMNGWDPTGGCIFYYNPAKTKNAYILSRKIVTTIGAHVFCL